MVLEIFTQLEEKGARIASCGSCPDHYGKRGQLNVGEIGSIDMTVDIMAAADEVIRPC